MFNLEATYRGKRVLVTGHTGFKGKWLCNALRGLGAEVFGYSLPDDVRDAVTLRYVVGVKRPDFVFHLAAQAFVPVGFRDPVATFETNVLGTVNLLEALLRVAAARPCAVVVVTSDKCYLPDKYQHVETDPLGGRCPYSASKAAAEQAVEAYRSAFFAPDHRIAVATARAGNVIGAGDKGEGRLVPNALRALKAGKPIPVYNPEAVRPWQYVADVIDGYLRLGAALAGGDRRAFCEPWNFSPRQHHTVREVVEEIIRAWGVGTWELQSTELRETQELRVSSWKARERLDWRPQWSFAGMIEETVAAEKASP
jgi:CDP-glucose 4,6-dehydratase